jgi:hypothetical protein
VIARRTARLPVLTAVALLVGASSLAVAQEVGPYDPLGIRAGSFLIFPSLSVSEVYDDNVFADPNDEQDDFVTVLRPEVRAQSNFSRHSLGFTAGGEIAFHVDQNDEDYQDAFVSTDGRLDITRQNYLDAQAEVARSHVSRDDPEDNRNDDLTDLYRYNAALSFTQLFNRLNFRLTGAANRTAYTDAGDADRDQNTYDALLRTGFFVSPRINTFIEGRYNVQHRDREVDFDGLERDSQGWGLGVGAAVDLTDLLTGEFQVGYRRQTFDEGSFNDEDGIGYSVNLTWTPTRLTTVVASGNGDFRPTSSQGSGAEANFRSTAGLSVRHELRRNVIIGANVNYIRDDFSGQDRTDDTALAGANASYLLNRNFSIDAGYTFSKRWSDDNNEEFVRNLIRLGITARL